MTPSLEIENYGCIRRLCLRLTPLHALIGPNDSGKSTILRALRALSRAADGVRDESVRDGMGDGTSLRVRLSDRSSYAIRIKGSSLEASFDEEDRELAQWLEALHLVDNPEKGLHPARIVDKVRALREMAQRQQVIIATHSGLVVNELSGEEVTLVTRTLEDGTRAIRLKDVPRFEEAMKTYLPGDYWVCFSDGYLEEPILSGRPLT